MLLDSFEDKYRDSNLSDKQKLSLTINLTEYVVGDKAFLRSKFNNQGSCTTVQYKQGLLIPDYQ